MLIFADRVSSHIVTGAVTVEKYFLCENFGKKRKNKRYDFSFSFFQAKRVNFFCKIKKMFIEIVLFDIIG